MIDLFTKQQIVEATPTIIMLAFVILSIWYSNTILYNMITRSGLNNKIPQKHIDLVTKITKIAIYFAGTIIILSTFQTQLTALAKTLGILTVGVGLALQKEISNVISGIFIIFNKSFKVNDYIVHKDFQGKITTIDISSTTLEHDGNIVIVPNHILHTTVIMIKKSQ